MNYPKVSVIVPCYNVEKYLDRCINSLVSCYYPEKELIFVNDGSTDRTFEILETASVNHTCIKIIHKHNDGVSSARNAGLAVATGEYVMFPDPDDYVSPDYISSPTRLIHSEKLDMVLFGFTANWSKNNSQDIFSIDEYDLRSNQEILDIVFPRFLGLSMDMMANYLRGGESAGVKRDRYGDGSIANHFWINTQYAL